MKNQWIKDTCWTNEPFLNGQVRAVTVSFHGLNGGYRNENATEFEIALAERGILVVAPY